MRPIWDDEEIPLGKPLWRYFKIEHFIRTLRCRTLYFPSAREFGDRFEGAVAVLPSEILIDPRYKEKDLIDQTFEELRRLTKISCWHRADYESHAMWKLYGAQGKGVAIRTTTTRLKKALLPFRLTPEHGQEEPWWGNVRYVDLHKERLNVSAGQQLFYKHRVFESEREFRVAISLRMAEEFGVAIPEFGIEVPFDPLILIESVYIGPEVIGLAQDEFVKACTDAGFNNQLLKSTLLGQPRFS